MSRVSRSRIGNGWIKYYLNGETYEGYDHEVIVRKKSWSKSSLSGMVRTKLIHDGVSASIHGLGNFWQSDLLEVPMRLNNTVRPRWVKRRISKQILKSDKYLTIEHKANHTSYNLLDMPNINRIANIIPIPDSLEGYWLVVTIDPDTLKVEHYFSKDRV